MIRYLHDTCGLSYSAIARACGRDRQSISRIARGKGAYTGRYKLDRLRRLYEAVTGDVTSGADPSTPAPYLAPSMAAPSMAAPAAPYPVAATHAPSQGRQGRQGRQGGVTWLEALAEAFAPAAALLREQNATAPPSPPSPRPSSTRAPAPPSATRPSSPPVSRPPSSPPISATPPARARPVEGGALPRVGIVLGPYDKCGRCGCILLREQLRAYVAPGNGARGLFCGQSCADAWAADIAASTPR